jgi:hypothetical protein
MGLAATQDTQPIAIAPGAATGLREYRAGSDQAPRAEGNCPAEGKQANGCEHGLEQHWSRQVLSL